MRLGNAVKVCACLEQVFYAPHIVTLSSTLGTKFQPIRYILDGDRIASNVFYSSSIAQVMTGFTILLFSRA